MDSSGEIAERILSRLGVEKAEDDNPQKTECPFDCSSKFSMLDEASEDVYRLGSGLTHLKARTEAHEHVIGELGSHYRNLWTDQRRVKEDIRQVREDVHQIKERLNEIDEKLCENREETAKLEEHAMALNAQLDQEKRQRKKSDESLGLLILLGLLFLGLISHQKLQTGASKELQYTQRTPVTPGELAEMAAREYVQLRGVSFNGGKS